MVFKFRNPRGGEIWEISGTLKEFMDRYYCGWMVQYLFSLLHLADSGEDSGMVVGKKITEKEGDLGLTANGIAQILTESLTGKQGLEHFLNDRRNVIFQGKDEMCVAPAELVAFERELGVDIPKLESGGYKAAFGNKDQEKIAAVSLYWDHLHAYGKPVPAESHF